MRKFIFLTPLVIATAANWDQVAQVAAPALAKFQTALSSPKMVAMPLKTAVLAKMKSTQSTATVAAVVTAAHAFTATLTAAQQTTLLQSYNATNVIKWSNLPCGSQCRIGLQLTNLTAAQVTAALAVVQAATGTVAGDGYNEIQQIRAADDNLSTGGGGNGYNNSIYFIAFLGTPSTTGTWQLQFGGHHLATNITYSGGNVTGSTPKFEGVEPLTFTTTNANVLPTGTVCAPLANEASTMLAMLNGLTTAQKATARLTQTFGDVVLGPNTDGQFPTTRVGIQCSQLTSAQQALVMAAMAPWVNDSDDAAAAQLLNYYQTQLANTYIAYAGTGNLTANGDYVRIDGPNVWIEFVCQTGVVYRSQIHYHSVWRDRARDYGGNFYGTYTTALSTKAADAAAVFSVYPIPATASSGLQVRLTTAASAATYTLRTMLGQVVAARSFSGSTIEVPTNALAPGPYLLSVQVAGQQAVTTRVVVN